MTEAAPRFITATRTTTPRLVDLVEAAYHLDGVLDDWIAGVLAHADELDHGLGVFGFLQRIVHTGVENLGVVVRGTPTDLGRIASARMRMEGHAEHVSFASSPLLRAGSYRAQIARAGIDPTPFDHIVAEFGLADLLGISTNLGGGLVFSIVAPTPTPWAERPSHIQRYQRLAAHLGAGLRLRDQLVELDRIPELVFRPDGKLVHAEREPWPALLERARQGVANVERARKKSMRESDPDGSLSLWQGLVSGRWSLVDRIDGIEGSRRTIVAYKNELELPRPPTLSPREATVARFIVGGASLKETAYTLGLSVSTVHDALTRAMKKLKVTHRAELAQVWQHAQVIPDADIVKVPLAVDPSAALADLTPAEREVATLIAEGRSTTEIARARGTSNHTVSNQLSALYDKLGVRSRGELAALLAGTREPKSENSLFR